MEPTKANRCFTKTIYASPEDYLSEFIDKYLKEQGNNIILVDIKYNSIVINGLWYESALLILRYDTDYE